MTDFRKNKRDVIIALRESYKDILQEEQEIQIRFNRLIEFLSHRSQSDFFYKQENKELRLCLSRAANQEFVISDQESDEMMDKAIQKKQMCLDLCQKLENIY